MPELAIKLPHTGEGAASLQRQQAIETELHLDARLSGWDAVVPRAMAQGRAWGRRYFVETVVPGSVAQPTAGIPDVILAMQASASGAIGELHRRTANKVLVDAHTVERWVDPPTRTVSRASLAIDHDERAAIFAAMRDRLATGLIGRELQVSWIHGDYWRGNVLIAADGVTPSGIVDWDRAAPGELPSHDLFHLLLSPRRELNRSIAPDIVSMLHGRSVWREEEKAILELARQRLPDDAVDDDVMALLYWLRHTAGTMNLYPRLLRDREYLSSEVEPVLRAVVASGTATERGAPNGPIEAA